MSSALNKQNTTALLSQYAELVQKSGGFPRFSDAALIKDAVSFFDSSVKKKPTFKDEGDPEIIAINILLQAVHKGQQLPNCPFNLTDAKLINEIIEFWVKEGGKEPKQDEAKEKRDKEGKAAKAAAASARHSQKFEDEDQDEGEEQPKKDGLSVQIPLDESSDDDDASIRPLLSKRGKGRAM